MLTHITQMYIVEHFNNFKKDEKSWKALFEIRVSKSFVQ